MTQGSIVAKPDGGPQTDRVRLALFAVGLALLALFLFRSLLAPGAVLFCTDDNIGAIASRQASYPEAFLRGWSDQSFIGQRETAMPGWTNLLIWALPARWIHNWLHALDVGLASFFFALFLRRRGVGWTGIVLGILAAFWVGSNFTLTYAGHIGKFGVLLFAALFLWLGEVAVTTRRAGPAWAALAGGALGAMFLEQADVALFFALVLGPYYLFRLRQTWGADGRAWVRRLAPLLAVALLVSIHPLLGGYSAHVQDAGPIGAGRADHWDFITQWSWPPEESIDFIAPGFMGWRSGEPAGPYWGRMGRSAEWDATGHGFMNFKLENQYLGAIPLALAALAAMRALRRSATVGRPSPRRAETLFWLSAAVVTLLLAYGKYTPLYALVIRLPAVSAVRAPVKWLQPFQLAVGILAAFGAQLLRDAGGWREVRLRRFSVVLGSVGGILLLAAGAVALGRAETASRLAAAGWGGAAPAIVSGRAVALAHGAALCGLAAMLPALLASRAARPTAGWRRFAPAAVVFLVAADAAWLSRHYITTLPPSLIAENALTRVLRAEVGNDRVALLTEQSFYGAWLTFHLPYQGIRALNFTQMPRMSSEVRSFLERMQPVPIRYWQLAGAPVVLAPGDIWRRAQQNPETRDLFEVKLAYRPAPAADGGIAVEPAATDDPDAHVVLRLRSPDARFALRTRWRVLDDAAALATLADPAHSPWTEAILAPEFIEPPLPAPSDGPSGLRVVSTRAGIHRLRVTADAPALVRVADRYDVRWRATLNGVPAPVARVDYLFLGVFVPPGDHELVLEYRAPRGTLALLGLGGLAALAALVGVLASGYRALSMGDGCE